MAKVILLVFLGGGLGAILRELFMMNVPAISDGFPLDILLANLLASLLLGIVTALHTRKLVSDDVNLFAGTGIMGGLSTFSSFAYGSMVLMSAPQAGFLVSALYIIISIAFGFIAVQLGLKCGGYRKQ